MGGVQGNPKFQGWMRSELRLYIVIIVPQMASRKEMGGHITPMQTAKGEGKH